MSDKENRNDGNKKGYLKLIIEIIFMIVVGFLTLYPLILFASILLI